MGCDAEPQNHLEAEEWPPGGPAVSEVEWPPPVRANLLPAKHTKYAKGMPFFASFAYFAGDPAPGDFVDLCAFESSWWMLIAWL